MDRPRPFSPKFIVVFVSMVLVGCYVMHRGHEGKALMPGSKSARVAQPEEPAPDAQAADRELMYSSKSGAVFRSNDVAADDAPATTQPARTKDPELMPGSKSDAIFGETVLYGDSAATQPAGRP